MNKSLFNRILIVLILLFGAISAASAADRVYIDTRYIEPGETKTFALNLENEAVFYGFQADIALPEGLEFVVENGSPLVFFSIRADSSYSLVMNLQDVGQLRMGAFSTSHSPISGEEGALLYLKVTANNEFEGGELALTNIHFIGENDRDVPFPDYSSYVRNHSENKCYIHDFSIAIGQTTTVSLLLDNETPFTAFQTDIYLPDGISIVEDSFSTTDRTAGHAVSSKSFSDGRTRITCFSLNNDVIPAGEGAVLEFTIRAAFANVNTYTIQLQNQIFSTASAEEFILPDTETELTVTITPVSEILLSESNVPLMVGESTEIYATVLPENATYSEVVWSSSDEEVASVDNGVITAHNVGTAIIRAESIDGFGVFAECVVEVSFSSGIDNFNSENVHVATEPLAATIHGVDGNASVELMDINGNRLYLGSNTRIEVAQPGIYILLVNNHPFKVRL